MGSTKIEQPSPPPQPSTADAIQAYVEGLPQMYETQMQYAPLLQQQQIGLMAQAYPQLVGIEQGLQQQYAPQQAQRAWEMQQQYAPLMAQQQQSLQKQFEPEAYAAREELGGLFDEDYLTEYQPEESSGFSMAKDRLTQDIRGAQTARGMFHSGMGAEQEQQALTEFTYPYAMNMENQRLQELGRRQNLAMSLTGRYGVPNVQNVNVPQLNMPSYQSPDLMSGYNFGGVQQGMQQGYGNYAGAYSSMYGANAQMAAANSPWGAVGNIAGGLAGGLGMGMGYGMMSDAALKDDIKHIKSALEVVNKMQGVEFDWMMTHDKDGGVVADDLERLLPQAVQELNGMKHIKPMMLVGYLIEAVKELSKQVEELRGK